MVAKHGSLSRLGFIPAKALGELRCRSEKELKRLEMNRGRTCVEPGCNTKLSAHNPDPICSPCARKHPPTKKDYAVTK